MVGEEDWRTLWIVRNYAQMLLALERPLEAEPLLREVLETARRVLGDDHPLTIRAIHSMGVAAHALDRIDEAERLGGAEAVMRARRVLPPASVLTGRYLFAHGKALQAQGRFAEAERAAAEALIG